MIYEPTKIRELRKLREMSQVDLAKRAKVSQATISAIEAGEPNVRHVTLVQVANALGVPLREIMKRPTKAEEADQIDTAISLAMALDPRTRAAWIAAGNALLGGQAKPDKQ